MWPLKSILCFFGFWVACVLSLVNPIIGVINYMMVYQINPNNTWWGKPLKDMGIRFSLLAAGFTVLGIFTSRKRIPNLRPYISLWELAILGLVLIGAINLINGVVHTPTSYYAFEKLWKTMLFVLILGRLVVSFDNLRMMVWCLVAGSLYLGHAAYTAPVSSFLLGRLDMIGGADFSTTSGAAAHFAAMLPIIGAAFLIAKRWRWKIFALMAGAFTVNAIVLCRTRSAFVGILCGAIAAMLLAPKVKRYRIQILLIVGMLASINLCDNYFWDRISTLTSRETLEEDAATKVRVAVWQASFEILGDYPLGIGPGNFTRIIGRYSPEHQQRSTHNTLVVCFVEYGVQGGGLFLLMIGGAIWMLYRSSGRAKHAREPFETKIYAYAFFISLIIYLVTGLGTERFYCESFWWVMTFPACLYRTVMNDVVVEATVPDLVNAPACYECDPSPGELQYI